VTIRSLDNLAELHDHYDVVFCDVWGVLHNGVSVFELAERALIKAREAGKIVILLTNSPRTFGEVISQLASIGAREDCYDAVVTSGDATRSLIAQAPRRLFLIGTYFDPALFDGLDCELVEEFEAEGVLVTGLNDDQNETPEDYRQQLERLRGRNLPLICANPDIEVGHGDKRLWCAGALARDYALLGGRVFVAGKPHAPIYALAQARAQELLGYQPEKKRILAIGDGILTDVKGAQSNNLDVIYIAGGIHAVHYQTGEEVSEHEMQNFFKVHNLTPTYVMMGLA